MSNDSDKLPSFQRDRLAKIERGEDPLSTLSQVFIDPRDAFIYSPVKLSMRQLGKMYADSWPEEETKHRMAAILRDRARNERWEEARAIIQAKRTSVRKDAILQAEAEIWAIIGLEFHSRRIRGLWDRWEMLDAYVTTELERCESGEGQFSTALRDACRELQAVEEQLVEIMPQLGIPERAKQFWASRSGSRDELIQRAEQKVLSVAGGAQASQVFELIRGGATGYDDPGAAVEED